MDYLCSNGEPINKSHPAVISPDVAVKNAYPGLTSNTDYTVEYQVLTLNFGAFSPEALEKNPVLDSKKGIDHLPVYIISSKSLIPVHSPSGVFTLSKQSTVFRAKREIDFVRISSII